MQKTTVTFFGAGAIGQAIAKTLKKNKNLTIYLWDRNRERVRPKNLPLEQMVSQADFLFFCLHSTVTRTAVKSALPYLKKNTIVVSVAKGIERGSNKFIPQVLVELLPQHQPYALLYGPMLASEISGGFGGAGVVAAKSKKTFNKIAKIFQGSDLLIEYSSDVAGVAVLGVLKNIYSIGLGMAEGLTWRSNIKSWLATKSLQEMVDLVEHFGGNHRTVFTTAGVGDLLATGFSDHSSNYRVGRELIKTRYCPLESEGCYSLPPLAKLLGKKIKKYKVLNTIAQIILAGKSARITFQKYIK